MDYRSYGRRDWPMKMRHKGRQPPSRRPVVPTHSLGYATSRADETDVSTSTDTIAAGVAATAMLRRCALQYCECQPLGHRVCKGLLATVRRLQPAAALHFGDSPIFKSSTEAPLLATASEVRRVA